MSAIITKNGKTRIYNGGTITIINGKMLIDGKPFDENDGIDVDEKVINITIEGSVDRLEIDYCDHVVVQGDAKRVHTQNGDIEVKGDVFGDVHTNCGDIECGDVEGDCHTNMGSIYRR